MRLVLFDIDGTLLRAHGAGSRAMERAGRKVLGSRFSLDGINIAGALDPWIYREAARLMGALDADSRHVDFHEEYLVALAHELESGSPRIEALPGVLLALAELSRREHITLGLVTGNYERAVPMKLRAVGIDPEPFVVSAFGDHGPTRPELVRLALGRWQARGAPGNPLHAVVVGDTPRDVDCARQNGVHCLAVCTGSYPAEALAAAGATAVARDLTDLGPLLEILDGA